MLADNLHADREMAKGLLDGVAEYAGADKKVEGKNAQDKPA